MPVAANETILMVEDTAVVRDTVKRKLVTLGYQVIDVTCAEEALAVLRSDQAIDLLFTDVVMPGEMGGGELADEARRLRPGLRILFTSGFTQIRSRPPQGGWTRANLVTKPYTTVELATRMHQALNGSNAV